MAEKYGNSPPKMPMRRESLILIQIEVGDYVEQDEEIATIETDKVRPQHETFRLKGT
jgi:uncharacterized membrane protein